MDGQVKLLKRAEKDEVEQEVIIGCRPPVGRRWHWKKSWGRAYQQSSKGTLPISSAMLQGYGESTYT
jgi:hypothetical protein